MGIATSSLKPHHHTHTSSQAPGLVRPPTPPNGPPDPPIFLSLSLHQEQPSTPLLDQQAHLGTLKIKTRG